MLVRSRLLTLAILLCAADAFAHTPSDPNAAATGLAGVFSPSPLARLARSIQGASILEVQDESFDANGNVVAFQASKGRLESDLLGRVPFDFKPQSFVPESCAKRLLIEVAIADIRSARWPHLRARAAIRSRATRGRGSRRG
jgi:hypothetical protein